MAVIITKENKVLEYNPTGKMTLDEIATILCIDQAELIFNSDTPYCIVASSRMANDGVNSIASLYCEKPIYGDAMFMSGSELRSNKKTLPHINELNSELSTKDFNRIIMNGFKDAITKVNYLYGIDSGITLKENRKTIYLDIQEIYQKMFDEEPEEESDEGMILKRPKKKFTEKDYNEILEKSYEGLEKHGKIINKDDCILFQDSECIVKLKPEIADLTLSYLMGYFVDKEEYEKCAFLRDIEFI